MKVDMSILTGRFDTSQPYVYRVDMRNKRVEFGAANRLDRSSSGQGGRRSPCPAIEQGRHPRHSARGDTPCDRSVHARSAVDPDWALRAVEIGQHQRVRNTCMVFRPGRNGAQASPESALGFGSAVASPWKDRGGTPPRSRSITYGVWFLPAPQCAPVPIGP